MLINYLEDSDVSHLEDKYPRLRFAVISHADLVPNYEGVGIYIDSLIKKLNSLHDVNGRILFCFVRSEKPFSSYKISDDLFAIAVDPKAVGYLFKLCRWIERKRPLNELLEKPQDELTEEYNGKYLMDIVKYVIFHQPNFIYSDSDAFIFECAILNIIAHEFAHIMHGHLDLIAKKEPCAIFNDREKYFLLLRTLEMDADSSATTSVISALGDRILGEERRNLLPAGLTRDEYVILSLKKMMIGLFMSIIYMDALSVSPNYKWPDAHPSGYGRFICIQNVAVSAMLKVDINIILEAEQSRAILVETFSQLSGSVASLGYPMASNVAIWGDNEVEHRYEKLGMDYVYFAEMKPLLDFWAVVRPLLEPLMRGGGLAPIQND